MEKECQQSTDTLITPKRAIDIDDLFPNKVDGEPIDELISRLSELKEQGVERIFQVVNPQTLTIQYKGVIPMISNVVSDIGTDYKAFMRGYNKEHAVCPNCGSRLLNRTCLGFILDWDHPERYQDRNIAKCQDCGWKGTVHNLVPEEN